MKIFLAGMDNNHNLWYNLMCQNKLPKIYGLFSYYYLSNKKHHFKLFSNGFEEVLIDSGAHTFHTARNVDFNKYTLKYANWIDKYSKQKNITGFFEMDIDNRIGYKNVLKLRKILEDKTDKIIPVWHKNRGNYKFKEMCKNYDYVSVSCLKIEGLTFNELEQYIRIAHKYDCKIHGLGGTRKEIIENTHFDSVDSISWLAPVQYNKLGLTGENYKKINHSKLMVYSYLKGVELQKQYMKR